MAKKSEKKDKKLKAQYNKKIFIIISVASGINLFYNFLFCYLKKNYIYSKKELFGIIILVILDLIYYKILDSFQGSFFESYLIDLFGLNILVQVLTIFSNKFYYLYLILPILLFWKIGGYLFEYISNIGKYDGTEEEDNNQQNKLKNLGHQSKNLNKEKKEKIKYVKY